MVERDVNPISVQNAEACIACGICAKKCPMGAVSIIEGCAAINNALCISCGMCAVSCPKGVICDAGGIFTRA